LRAFLALQADEVERLTKQLVDARHVEGYGELVYAAFVTAVRRRFSPTWTIPDAIRFVATVLARLLDNEIEIDPLTAEILVRRWIAVNGWAGLTGRTAASARTGAVARDLSESASGT
jgi:hypothetical protein